MARIRTIKPEAFRSRTIKKLSYPARWTFFGLLVQVDDKGRAMDDIDLIRADVYPLEMDEVSAKDVEMHIEELSSPSIDMVCRYSVDGQRFLHVINFGKHQRINRASESHIPCCPIHGDGDEPKGKKPTANPSPEPGISDPSQPPHGALTEDTVSPQPSRARAGSGSGREKEVEGEKEGGLATLFELPTPALPELPAAAPPADDPCGESIAEIVEDSEEEVEETAHWLLGRWLEFRGKSRPPEKIIGRVGKELRLLLDEGINFQDVRLGFGHWAIKGADPSAIASFVNEAATRRVVAEQRIPMPGQRRQSTTERITVDGLAMAAELAAEEGTDLATILQFRTSMPKELTA